MMGQEPCNRATLAQTPRIYSNIDPTQDDIFPCRCSMSTEFLQISAAYTLALGLEGMACPI